MAEKIFEVTSTIEDERIRIFRKLMTVKGECSEMPVDCYVISTQRFTVICDTLLTPEDMATVMNIVQPASPILVINSHADWDHTWGNCYFTEGRAVPIIGHAACRARLQSAEARAELQRFQQRESQFQQVNLVPPTLTFSSGLTIDGGDLTLELFAAPGHCKDHCALWIPESQVLFAFDAVEQPVFSIADAESVPDVFATLGHFQTLRPAHVLCSHSAADPQTISHQLAYMRQLEASCRQLLCSQTTQGTRVEDKQIIELSEMVWATVPHGHNNAVDTNDDFYREVSQQNARFILEWVGLTISGGFNGYGV